MTGNLPITVNPTDSFPHLPRAPIVEAVVQFRTRAEQMPEVNQFKSNLRAMFPDYSQVKTIGSVSVSVPLSLDPHSHSSATRSTDRSWLGLRIETEDGLNVGMFTRDFFSFSRLRPYENWSHFTTEAMRLWTAHEQLCSPSEIGRLGVRFINRFDVPLVDLNPSHYLKGIPAPAGDLDRSGFLYRDELAVPGHPLAAVLMRTIQPGGATMPDKAALLLDIDVFTLQPFPPDRTTIAERLSELQILKNRMFFKNIEPPALEMCR